MGAMKETDEDLSTNPGIAQQYQNRLSTARSSQSYGSYETGESSTAPSLDDTFTGSTTISHPPHKSTTNDTTSNSYALDQRSRNMDRERDRDLNHEVHKRRRSHKPRSSGGFLLANPMLNEPSKGVSPNRDGSRRLSRIPVDHRKGKTSMTLSTNLSDRSNATNLRTGLGIDEQGMRRSSDGPLSRSRTASPIPEEDRRHSQGGRRVSRIPTPTSRPGTPLDVDSTNIVNMALNLSESRRMAERRNMSSPIPPRLAQLPDATAGGGLKQHFQQQRRTSRTISPRPDRGLTPRAASASRIPSPLQPTFETESSYQYHFSSSTLNRAQKAKEYLELMAQYRRLLQIVPPLKQDTRSRPPSSNLSTSPTSSKPPLNPLTGAPQVVLGRPYNPLQYIRNRKVRARERKAIDGGAQGFSDISRVSCWIDQTAKTTATSAVSLGPYLLPPFQSAHEVDQERPSNIPRPISTLAKPKRVRIDWIIDPADMLADTYWMEQDDNKYLIEDRHYSKIFPRKPEAQSPPRQTNEPAASALSISTRDGDIGDTNTASEADIISPIRAESEMPLVSARERARQKLHDFRGHHKQNGLSHSHHDFLRFRKGSLSDTSDSENDRRRRNRTGTISADGTDLLEKQMKEMMAKEEQIEKENIDETNRGLLKQLPARMTTPDKGSRTPEEIISRREPRAEVPDNQDKATRGKGSPLSSVVGSGRPSLEVPGKSYRLSMDIDSSRPHSPDARLPRGRQAQAPMIGLDLSPPESRPNSPGRKPFSKVKNIFRDRSRDRERERERERVANNLAREKDDRVESPIEPPEQLNLSTLTTERFQSPDRRRSKSLNRKIIQRSTGESHRSHKSVSSISKMKGDDQVGLRSIFKGGAKLDGMIRGGVSKVTDLLWKKDSDSDDSSSSSSSDSEEEPKRGRTKGSTNVSRSSSRRPRDNSRQRNYQEVMPPFKQTLLLHDKPLPEEIDPLPAMSPTSRPSRSPRFDRLKPPRIDVRKASPPSTDLVPTRSRVLRDSSDISDLEPFPAPQGVKLQDLSKDTTLVLHAPQPRPRMGSRTLSQPARDWSISNHSPSQQGGQISRREVARLRALILCSGIKAMEISRRAHEPHPLFALDNTNKGLVAGLAWSDVARFVPDQKAMGLLAPELELFPATAGVIIASIDNSLLLSEKNTARFAVETAPVLQRRIEELHDRVAGDLMEMTHRAADEADEVNRDLMDSQRLKVKTVTDTMDKMLRRRRRRFRWARRAGWLAVEWVLVGFMWYVWFVVMLARIVLGVGKGIVGVGKWLLWL